MKRRTVPGWVVIASFAAVAIAALVLLVLPPSTQNAHNVASSPAAQVFPKADCCVPSTDLRGVWSSTNEKGGTFTADISDKSIKIYMSADDTSVMYWSGTFDSYKPVGSVITSRVSDDAEFFLSKSTEKDFVVGETTLTFDFTMRGVTKKVNLSRV